MLGPVFLPVRKVTYSFHVLIEWPFHVRKLERNC